MPSGEIKSFIDWLTSKVIRKNKDQLLFEIIKFLPDYITPNSLVYLRLLFTNILLFLLVNNSKGLLAWGIIIYLICKFLDLLDGSLARYRKQQTIMGEIYDPLSDRLLNLVGLVILIKLWQIQALWVYFFVNLISVIIFLINLISLGTKLSDKPIGNYFRKVLEVAGLVLTVILLIYELK